MRRYGVILALLAVAAAGCSRDRAGALPSTSPAPSAPTATTAPTVEERLVAAAREYFALLERAGRGDVAALDPRVASRCSCRQQVDFLRNETAAGRRVTTTYAVESVDATATSDAGGTAAVTFSTAASQVLDASGREVRAIPAVAHAGLELTFRLTADSWVLERAVRL